MAVKEITFKCERVSSYWALGGIRFYDVDGNMYPIKFTTKSNSTIGVFYIQGTQITGKVTTTNSYGTYYYVDYPFDTDKPIVGTYANANYWLSSSTDTIKITFDTPINISKISFVPYCDTISDRKQKSIEIKATDENNAVVLLEKHDTSAYVAQQVFYAETPTLSFLRKFLLKSNNKVYSLNSIDEVYNTNMTSNISPYPFVASASSIYSTNYPAWVGFNGVKTGGNNCWIGLNGVLTNQWLQIDYGRKTMVNQLEITGLGSNPTGSPKDFEVQGSNDGVNFIKIKKFSGETNWKAYEERVYSFGVSNYRYYRLFIYTNNGYTSYVGVTHLLYSAKNIGITKEIPVVSMDNFVNYGENKLVLSNLSQNKNYILQDTVSENSDGLWKTELNRKPLSIGFN